jgi:hypothetical protein
MGMLYGDMMEQIAIWALGSFALGFCMPLAGLLACAGARPGLRTSNWRPELLTDEAAEKRLWTKAQKVSAAIVVFLGLAFLPLSLGAMTGMVILRLAARVYAAARRAEGAAKRSLPREGATPDLPRPVESSGNLVSAA